MSLFLINIKKANIDLKINQNIGIEGLGNDINTIFFKKQTWKKTFKQVS